MAKAKRKVAAEKKPAAAAAFAAPAADAAAEFAAPAAGAAPAVGAGTATDAAPGIREGRVRAVIDAVLPAVDGGRFPVKRIAGEAVAIASRVTSPRCALALRPDAEILNPCAEIRERDFIRLAPFIVTSVSGRDAINRRAHHRGCEAEWL